ncbi:MAG: hypothetical protein EOO89_21840, partial [Pedobacter sp.]
MKVTNACGSATDAVKVTVETTLPIVDLGIDKSICPDIDFILDAGNLGASYFWSNGDITRTLNVNLAVKDTFWVDV